MEFEQAKEYVSYVVDNALAGRPLNEDIHAVVTPDSVLIGWQCGFEPMFVACNNYLGGRLDIEEAEEIAIDYLREIGWFSDPDAGNFSDYQIVNN